MDLELHAIVACFDKPITEAARVLGTCTTNLKKVCRNHGIARWPYRKMRSIETNLEKLQQDEQCIPLKGEAMIKELMRQKEALLNLNQQPSVRKLKKSRSRSYEEQSASGSSDDSFEECAPQASSFKRTKKNFTTKLASLGQQSHPASAAGDSIDTLPPPTLNVSPNTNNHMSSSCFSFAPSVIFAGTADLPDQQVIPASPLELPTVNTVTAINSVELFDIGFDIFANIDVAEDLEYSRSLELTSQSDDVNLDLNLLFPLIEVM